MKPLLVLLSVIVGLAYAKQYCETTDDCSHLGDGVECSYSMCDQWGICGCPRGKTMYFLGSYRKFACVPIKKIGESCSTYSDTGFCGATNSYCREGTCRCKFDDTATGVPTYETRWGGEACLPVQDEFEAGEACITTADCVDGLTCVNSVGSNGLNNANFRWDRYTDINGNSEHFQHLPQTPMDHNVRVCGCAEGERLTVPNEFSTATLMGGRKPTCEPIRLGDKCIRDSDCLSILSMKITPGSGTIKAQNSGWNIKNNDDNKAAKCVNNKCECNDNNEVGDITRMYCAPALGAGDLCAVQGAVGSSSQAVVGVCNGDLGFMCGNPCEFDTFSDENDKDKNYTCTCAPGWNGRGTNSCSRVTEGASCVGDFQCSSLAWDAICLDGACTTNGALPVTATVLTLCLPLLAFLVNRN